MVSQPLLLNIAHKALVPILGHIINISIANGVYPDELKLARVTPIFKSGSKDDPTNYRPISVLSTIDKIFESVIKSRFIDFLNKNDFFYSHQYGFRAKSGTHTAAYELINNISQELDLGKVVSGIFLDLSKAFDCVNHTILLHKLEYAGIRGNALNLIRSYLSNRKQRTRIGKNNSPFVDINIGIPQGSILGPLLFLIYINDFSKLPLIGTPYLYADDSAIFYANEGVANNIGNIKEDMAKIIEYFRINRLSLNISKSNVMHFHSKRRSLIDVADISITENMTIKLVSSVKYLGLILDSCLSWRCHITALCKRIAPKIGIINKLRFMLPRTITKKLYFSLVHSNISYLAGVWGCAYNAVLQPLQILQNRAMKFSLQLPRLFSTVELYKYDQRRVLNVNGLYRFQISKFVHQCIHDLAYHTITFGNTNHNHNTRNRNGLRRPIARRRFGQMAIIVAGPIMYESIPQSIRNILTYSRFSADLKKWIHSVQ